MDIWLSVLIAAQVLAALGVIVLVLLQHGKGADMGAAFGSGASGSLFGATGSANFLSRATAWLAGGFFACTLGLALLAGQQRVGGATGSGSVMERVDPGKTEPKGESTPSASPPVDAPSQIPGAAPAGSGSSGAGSTPSAPANTDGASPGGATNPSGAGTTTDGAAGTNGAANPAPSSPAAGGTEAAPSSVIPPQPGSMGVVKPADAPPAQPAGEAKPADQSSPAASENSK